jgi:hypothetical protein
MGLRRPPSPERFKEQLFLTRSGGWLFLVLFRVLFCVYDLLKARMRLAGNA